MGRSEKSRPARRWWKRVLRILINLVALLLVISLGAGAWLHLQAEREEDEAIDQVRSAIADLTRQIRLHAAMGKTELNGRGWPETIDPAWFEGHPPRHCLVSTDRPWLEVAPIEQADLLNPPVRVAVNKNLAAFWYNPGSGVIRARAPESVSDRRATEIYNRINSTSLTSIFEDIVPRERLMKRDPAPVAGAPDEASKTATAEEQPRDLDPTKPQ